MEQATIACLWNTRNSKKQAMCGTPGVTKGRQITSEYLGNLHQIFSIHFVCQLMLVENPATNTDRNITEPDIVVDHIEKSTSGNIQHCTTSPAILFSDPHATSEK